MRRHLVEHVLGIVLILAALLFAATAEAYVNVRGYYRSNGTYVQPYVRSNPNGLRYDNYNYRPSQGLYNPSYNTGGTNWNTPTWQTDPNYYQGQSLYNSSPLRTTPSFYNPTPLRTTPSFYTPPTPIRTTPSYYYGF